MKSPFLSEIAKNYLFCTKRFSGGFYGPGQGPDVFRFCPGEIVKLPGFRGVVVGSHDVGASGMQLFEEISYGGVVLGTKSTGDVGREIPGLAHGKIGWIEIDKIVFSGAFTGLAEIAVENRNVMLLEPRGDGADVIGVNGGASLFAVVGDIEEALTVDPVEAVEAVLVEPDEESGLLQIEDSMDAGVVGGSEVPIAGRVRWHSVQGRYGLNEIFRVRGYLFPDVYELGVGIADNGFLRLQGQEQRAAADEGLIIGVIFVRNKLLEAWNEAPFASGPFDKRTENRQRFHFLLALKYWPAGHDLVFAGRPYVRKRGGGYLLVSASVPDSVELTEFSEEPEVSGTPGVSGVSVSVFSEALLSSSRAFARSVLY